jgi:YD repeat-containing protein
MVSFRQACVTAAGWRLTSSSTHNYQYDADGNVLEEKNITTSETKRYRYGSENQLLGYEHYAANSPLPDITATYTYDLYGRRLQRRLTAPPPTSSGKMTTWPLSICLSPFCLSPFCPQNGHIMMMVPAVPNVDTYFLTFLTDFYEMVSRMLIKNQW